MLEDETYQREMLEKTWTSFHGLGGENGNFMSHAYFLETTESSSQSGDTSVKGFSMEEFQALRRLITQISYYYTSSPS